MSPDLIESIITISSCEDIYVKNINNKFKEYYTSEMYKPSNFVSPEIDCDIRVDSAYELGWFLFNKIFKKVPSEFHILKKYNLEVLDFLKKEAKLLYRKIVDESELKDSKLCEINYVFLYKNAVICINYFYLLDKDKAVVKGIQVYYDLEKKLDLSDLEKFEISSELEKPKLGIIKQNKFGPSVTWKEFNSNKEFSNDNYNKDFEVFSEDLITKLKNEQNGLYLLYGEPGTGKSSAIKHFISKVKRSFVFIPPQMINYLSTPEFSDFVTTNLKNCVLIIEDAEKALMKRETEDGFFNSELVSSLLNLTDGLYADITSISVIATYNCDRNFIDPALLRKGRLKAEYKFNRLTVERSQKLVDKLELDLDVTEPMTLADIYNYEKQYTNDKKEKKEKRNIGFAS